MNTVNDTGDQGNRDGLVEAFIDGKHMSTWSGLRLRNEEGFGTDRMKIYFFFSGDKGRFACVRDEWAFFDDFCCFVYKPQAYVPRFNETSPLGCVLDLPFRKEQANGGSCYRLGLPH